MKRWALILLVLAACKGGTTEPPASARVKLVRSGGDRVAVEVSGAPASARAIEVVLEVDGGSFTFDAAAAPDGLALDTVRIAQAGANRAVLFAGDKRGVGLPAFGQVATFRLVGDGSEARLSIARALLADADGRRVELDSTATLTVR